MKKEKTVKKKRGGWKGGPDRGCLRAKKQKQKKESTGKEREGQKRCIWGTGHDAEKKKRPRNFLVL